MGFVTINGYSIPMDQFRSREITDNTISQGTIDLYMLIFLLGPGKSYKHNARFEPLLGFLVNNPLDDDSWITPEMRRKYGRYSYSRN